MSKQSKTKGNENVDMVDEVIEDFTVVKSENIEEEIEINDASETKKVPKKIVVKKSGEKPSFFASCGAILSDTIIISVVSVGLLYVVDFILKNAAGLQIVEKEQMLILIYLVVSLLYVSILESTLGFTCGKSILGMKVVRN